MRPIRRMSSAAALALLTLLTLLIMAPVAAAASAADEISPTITPTNGPTEPMALATTGLNIMVPVVIGIATLVVGIGLLSWAFLRTSSTDHR